MEAHGNGVMPKGARERRKGARCDATSDQSTLKGREVKPDTRDLLPSIDRRFERAV